MPGDGTKEGEGRRAGRVRRAPAGAARRAGLTQEQLADAAGLHWTYVGQVERGERNLTYKSILRLAEGLAVDPRELFAAGTLSRHEAARLSSRFVGRHGTRSVRRSLARWERMFVRERVR